MNSRIHIAFSVTMSIVVLFAIVWGIDLAGSPATARIQRLDQQRLDDLQTIFREVQLLCHDPDIKNKLKRHLPLTLEELAELARSERINLTDPETGLSYVYTVTTKRLMCCAQHFHRGGTRIFTFSGTTHQANTLSPSTR